MEKDRWELNMFGCPTFLETLVIEKWKTTGLCLQASYSTNKHFLVIIISAYLKGIMIYLLLALTIILM